MFGPTPGSLQVPPAGPTRPVCIEVAGEVVGIIRARELGAGPTNPRWPLRESRNRGARAHRKHATCRRNPGDSRRRAGGWNRDRKSTRLNSSHLGISYAVFCLKKNVLIITPH